MVHVLVDQATRHFPCLPRQQESVSLVLVLGREREHVEYALPAGADVC